MQMVSAFIVTPTNRLWNQSPSSGPISISISRASRFATTSPSSSDVSDEITPAAALTTPCARSNTPMTISQVLVTIMTAQNVLNIHLKNTQVSKSCMLFFSITSCKSSIVITMARITPAMGRIT